MFMYVVAFFFYESRKYSIYLKYIDTYNKYILWKCQIRGMVWLYYSTTDRFHCIKFACTVFVEGLVILCSELQWLTIFF